MRYGCVLFDLDGTLVDGRRGIVAGMRHALEQLGGTFEVDDLSKLIGPPLQDVFKDAFGFTGARVDEAVVAYREHYTAEGIFDAEVYAGIPELLASLDGTLAVATSKPHVYAERLLEHFDLRRHLEFVAGPELDGTRRRKADLIEYALDHLPGARKETTVMIGDRRYDIEGAKATGVASISVGWGFGAAEELATANADHNAQTVAELQNLLL